jgi:DNA-binding HxlR family transcriptional regulator
MPRFRDALEDVLSHRSDRLIVLTLATQEDELRYEALRRIIGEESPQLFKQALGRLGRNALINRRVRQQGRRYMTFLSATKVGLQLGSLLLMWASDEALPPNFPETARRDVQEMFSPPALLAQ